MTAHSIAPLPSCIGFLLKSTKHSRCQGRRARLMSPKLRSRSTLTRLISTFAHESGNDSRQAASGNDKLPSNTIFTASSRNTVVYRPCGISFILTPPSLYCIRLWCPLFPFYITSYPMRGTDCHLQPRETVREEHNFYNKDFNQFV
jgi:hypothetical protein